MTRVKLTYFIYKTLLLPNGEKQQQAHHNCFFFFSKMILLLFYIRGFFLLITQMSRVSKLSTNNENFVKNSKVAMLRYKTDVCCWPKRNKLWKLLYLPWDDVFFFNIIMKSEKGFFSNFEHILMIYVGKILKRCLLSFVKGLFWHDNWQKSNTF